ncbi:MAG: hypothetical protein GXO55_05305 [Chloroflexi bacterium]|nr:hypothetical protein [Chloroflexota bacterium]
MQWSSLRVIAKKEIIYASRRPVYWVSSVLLVIFVIWLSVSAATGAIQNIAQTSSDLADYLARIYPQMFFLLQPFSLFLLMSLYLFSEIFIMEKAQGRLEMLMTAPITVKNIWLGKSVSLLVLVYPFVLLTEVLYAVVWVYTAKGLVPTPFAVTAPTLLIGVLLGPMLAFAIISLLGLISFVAEQVSTVQLSAFFMSFGAAFGGSYLLSWLQKRLFVQRADLIRWPMVVGALVLIGLIGGVMWVLQKRIEKDRIARTFG